MKSKSYEEFVEKFKPKKTTDDCYTPPEIYNVIRDWACREYDILPEKIVRPFCPGGDYEHYDYPEGCVVLDNPPFSIISKICDFYLERAIPFFLFCPSLTAFSSNNTVMRACHIICDANIIYDNGANVKTSFVTNLEGDIVTRTGCELTKEINRMSKKLKEGKVKQLPKYDYPDHVITAAMLQKYTHYGVDFKVHRKECYHIRILDSQKEAGKQIYGGGLILSKAKAAEKAAAEKAGKKIWELSDREIAIVESLKN